MPGVGVREQVRSRTAAIRGEVNTPIIPPDFEPVNFEFYIFSGEKLLQEQRRWVLLTHTLSLLRGT